MAKSIIFCPYFGRLPSHFPLWMNSCRENREFDFVVFTDDEIQQCRDVPNNVKIIPIRFEDLCQQVQRRFDFKISLETPYKLCDFKPAYGYIFSEYTTGYDYWGYCDLDVIFGQLRRYMPEGNYAKVSHMGHLCLYRNTEDVTQAFRRGKGAVNYKMILARKENFAFDEIGTYGINAILQSEGSLIYPFEKHIADISCYSPDLKIFDHKNSKNGVLKNRYLFEFDNGKLYGYTAAQNRLEKTEFAYVHFQKRKVINNVTKNNEHFLLFPHAFEDYLPVDAALFEKAKEIRVPLQQFAAIKLKAGLNKSKRIFAITILKMKGQ